MEINNPRKLTNKEIKSIKFVKVLFENKSSMENNLKYNIEEIMVSNEWYPTTPGVVFRSNKIMLSNPRLITDDEAMKLYKVSNLKEDLFPKAMIGCLKSKFIKTAKQILKDKINKTNINYTLEEFCDTFKDLNLLDDNSKYIYDELLKIQKE